MKLRPLAPTHSIVKTKMGNYVRRKVSDPENFMLEKNSKGFVKNMVKNFFYSIEIIYI